jgi:ribose 5-phosphate isomerase B
MTTSTRIVLAADHAGFPLKEDVKKYLMEKGLDVVDVGTFSTESVDYPAIMRKGAAAVLEYKCPGIIFGKSGNGEAMAANKVKGIRAALCYNTEITRLARAHNDANIMSIGADFTNPTLAREMVDLFLETPFDGERHVARVNDIDTPLL